MRFLDAGAIPLYIEQAEGCGVFVHVAEHLLKEGLMLLLANSEPGIRHQVPERKRGG